MSLFHIAGYVTCKDESEGEEDLLNETMFYATKYGNYTDGLNRGKLKIPVDRCCQWTFFCFILFGAVDDKVCQKSLQSIFFEISEYYGFRMKEHHAKIMANICLKNYCKAVTPRDSKEADIKVIKLRYLLFC